MIPQPYPLYARTWTKEDPTVRTAAVIGWEEDPDGALPQIPVVAFLTDGHTRGLSMLLAADTDDPDRWHFTVHPDDDWTPGDPS